ncbi:MAG: 30S ribosomal protein S4, partial [Myxococcales bacterium]|nr:30S ribosomal protein S4 [Myxococcales bacterium]
KMRALGVYLPGLSTKGIDRRPHPPGQHGQARRKRPSDYALQLREKQKLALNYGLTERQMRRLMDQARRSPTATGEKLAQLIERRLDNVVYRAGWAKTIPAARQLVNHRHVTVNARVTDIASYRVSVGDKIQLREKSKEHPAVVEALDGGVPYMPWYLETGENNSFEVTGLPGANDLPFELDLKLVIEHYSRHL